MQVGSLFCVVLEESSWFILYLKSTVSLYLKSTVSLLPNTIKATFFSVTFREWLLNNLSKGKSVKTGESWSLVFGITIWKLWYWRNQFLFANISLFSLRVVSDIRAWVHA